MERRERKEGRRGRGGEKEGRGTTVGGPETTARDGRALVWAWGFVEWDAGGGGGERGGGGSTLVYVRWRSWSRGGGAFVVRCCGRVRVP